MTTPGIFDVIAMPDDIATLPDPAPFYHAVSKDQAFLVKKTMFGKALVPVKTIDHLPTGETGRIWWTNPMPKIPASIISQVWSFFRTIHRTKGSESMVYLTYKDGEWRPFIPPQEASYTHVRADFKLTNVTPGWLIACSIHSHCDFGGFHSGTDEKDAREHDGLHITIGDVDKDEPDVAAMVSVSGSLFNVKPVDIIDGKLDKFASHPAFWDHFVRGQSFRPKPRNGYETIMSGKPGYQPYQIPASWQDDDDYLDWALKRSKQQQGKTTYKRYYYERSFFDLVELAVRNGDLIGDENEAFSWAVDMDARLEQMVEEAAEFGIDAETILRKAKNVTKLGHEYEYGAEEDDTDEDIRGANRMLLGDGDDILDLLSTGYNQ